MFHVRPDSVVRRPALSQRRREQGVACRAGRTQESRWCAVRSVPRKIFTSGRNFR